MTSTEFDQLVQGARERQDQLLKVKGDDYTRHEDDRLSNFKRSGASIGLSPIQVWAIFINKHIDAVMAFVKTGRTESESIQGRLDDIVNYCYLGEALVRETRETAPTSQYINAYSLTGTVEIEKAVLGREMTSTQSGPTLDRYIS